MTYFIGDVHGKYGRYKKLIKKYPNSIQVGDMGIGFKRVWAEGVFPNPPHETMVKTGARFIRGNHDNPKECKEHSQYIPDGYYENDMMFIGGALSIDKIWRQWGSTWWPDEELSQKELLGLQEKYLDLKPKIMVTHECPEIIAKHLIMGYVEKSEFASITRQAFQNYWELYKPEVWIFGHWHQSIDKIVQGTRFVCLNELEVKGI